MTQPEVFETVKASVLKVAPDLDPSLLTPATSLRDLGMNSVDRVEVIIMCMEELGLAEPMRSLGAITTLQSLATLLHSRLSRRA